MRLKKLMLAAAAVSMTASPVLAAPSTYAVDVRSSEEAGESQLRGGGFFVAIIAAAAVIAGIIIVAQEDDEPNSP